MQVQVNLSEQASELVQKIFSFSGTGVCAGVIRLSFKPEEENKLSQYLFQPSFMEIGLPKLGKAFKGNRFISDPRNVYPLENVNPAASWFLKALAEADGDKTAPDLPALMEAARRAEIQSDISNRVRNFFESAGKQQLFNVTDLDLTEWAKDFLKDLENTLIDKNKDRGLKGTNKEGFLKLLDSFLKDTELKLRATVKHDNVTMKRTAARAADDALTAVLATKTTVRKQRAGLFTEKNGKKLAELSAEADQLLKEHFQDFPFVNMSGLEISVLCAAVSLYEVQKNITRYNSIRKKGGQPLLMDSKEIAEKAGTFKRLPKKEQEKQYSKMMIEIEPKVFLNRMGIKTVRKRAIDKVRETLQKLSNMPYTVQGLSNRGTIITVNGSRPLLCFEQVTEKQQKGAKKCAEIWKISHPSTAFVHKFGKDGGTVLLPMVIVRNINQKADERSAEALIKASLMVYLELLRVYDHTELQEKKEAKKLHKAVASEITVDIEKKLMDLNLNRMNRDQLLSILCDSLNKAGIKTEIHGNVLKATYTGNP